MKQLELPERLERAITKLYMAFHNGKLNAARCKHCACGNIVGNSTSWSIFRKKLGVFNPRPSKYKNVFEMQKKAVEVINNSGYSPSEIIEIERVFLNSMGINSFKEKDWKGYKKKDKERNYKGLCAVVEYLCELDNVPNVMDIQGLFEYDQENNPKNELNLVIA